MYHLWKIAHDLSRLSHHYDGLKQSVLVCTCADRRNNLGNTSAQTRCWLSHRLTALYQMSTRVHCESSRSFLSNQKVNICLSSCHCSWRERSCSTMMYHRWCWQTWTLPGIHPLVWRRCHHLRFCDTNKGLVPSKNPQCGARLVFDHWAFPNSVQKHSTDLQVEAVFLRLHWSLF